MRLRLSMAYVRALILSAALLASACAAPPAGVAPLVTVAPLPTAPPSPMPTATPTVAPATPSPTPAAFGGAILALDATVAARITTLIEASGGEAAVVVADGPAGTIVLEVAADDVVLSASLYKLAVLLEAENRIDLGTLKPTDRITITLADQRDGASYTKTGTTLAIEDALERTITLSDNASALALVRKLSVAAIHATLDREGLSGQRFTSRGSVTTARTIATFFSELSRGALISAAASERMLARLSRQRVNDRIPAVLPPGTVLGHKTGNLGFVTHDAGLISGPGGVPVVLVVLTWDTSEEKGSQLIRDITAAVYAGLTKP